MQPKTKSPAPLYAAVVRILIRTTDEGRLLQLARDLAGSLRVFAHPNGNELIPLQNDDYPFEEHIEDVLLRQTRRTGMLLNSDELTGFVHLPSSAVRSPVFQRQTTKTKAAPAIVRQPGLLLGTNNHAGETVEVRLSAEQRTRHTHIIGSSGTGKSTLLFNLIKQDIENGEGVLIEPAFRNDFLKSVKDSEVVYYWQKSFPHLSGNKSIGSILTRLDTFLAQKPIRHMVSQPEITPLATAKPINVPSSRKANGVCMKLHRS